MLPIQRDTTLLLCANEKHEVFTTLRVQKRKRNILHVMINNKQFTILQNTKGVPNGRNNEKEEKDQSKKRKNLGEIPSNQWRRERRNKVCFE